MSRQHCCDCSINWKFIILLKLIARFFLYDLTLKVFHSLGKKHRGKYLSCDFPPISMERGATNSISGKYDVTTKLKVSTTSLILLKITFIILYDIFMLCTFEQFTRIFRVYHETAYILIIKSACISWDTSEYMYMYFRTVNEHNNPFTCVLKILYSVIFSWSQNVKQLFKVPVEFAWKSFENFLVIFMYLNCF